MLKKVLTNLKDDNYMYKCITMKFKMLLKIPILASGISYHSKKVMYQIKIYLQNFDPMYLDRQNY